jgi:membrane protease YdiL (CAAX protease family)
LSSEAPPAPAPRWPRARRTLNIAAVTTLVVAALSYVLPDEYANNAVAIVFLAVTYFTVLRGDEQLVRAYGLSLGGLTEPRALSAKRLLRDGAQALGWALLLAAIFFPPFWFGYRWWWHAGSFRWQPPAELINLALGQLLVVALPEEAFYRGFLQSALEGRWAHRQVTILGAKVGPGLVLSCAIFALGHLLTIPHPARLAVFGPALLFGWLRARTGGIGASLVFHALCNLFSASLAHGYGLGS